MGKNYPGRGKPWVKDPNGNQNSRTVLQADVPAVYLTHSEINEARRQLEKENKSDAEKKKSCVLERKIYKAMWEKSDPKKNGMRSAQ